ncbi:hypothetical protein C8R43DRAFT_1129416 [Mycena crocata]|nr:hypothetical protein C8R43DRAFT_1129416 [Mycena crocata]
MNAYDTKIRRPDGALLLHGAATKPARFFQNSVRHLMLDHFAGWSRGDAHTFLLRCPNIVNLFLTNKFSDPSVLPVLARMRIRRFSGHLMRLFGRFEEVDLTHPSLASLTHLHMFDAREGHGPIVWRPHLAALPALTHLALEFLTIPRSGAREILSDCAHLEVLVVTGKLTGEEKPSLNDDRLVITRIHEFYPRDWEIGARGGMDFWTAADLFIAKKRRGEIAGELLCVSSPFPQLLRISSSMTHAWAFPASVYFMEY